MSLSKLVSSPTSHAPSPCPRRCRHRATRTTAAVTVIPILTATRTTAHSRDHGPAPSSRSAGAVVVAAARSGAVADLQGHAGADLQGQAVAETGRVASLRASSGADAPGNAFLETRANSNSAARTLTTTIEPDNYDAFLIKFRLLSGEEFGFVRVPKDAMKEATTRGKSLSDLGVSVGDVQIARFSSDKVTLVSAGGRVLLRSEGAAQAATAAGDNQESVDVWLSEAFLDVVPGAWQKLIKSFEDAGAGLGSSGRVRAYLVFLQIEV